MYVLNSESYFGSRCYMWPRTSSVPAAFVWQNRALIITDTCRYQLDKPAIGNWTTHTVQMTQRNKT